MKHENTVRMQNWQVLLPNCKTQHVTLPSLLCKHSVHPQHVMLIEAGFMHVMHTNTALRVTLLQLNVRHVLRPQTLEDLQDLSPECN